MAERQSDFSNRGLNNLKQGKSTEAIADFDRTLQLDQTCAAAFQKRGLCWYFLGEPEIAYADLGKACDLFEEQGDASGYKIAWAAFLQLLLQNTRNCST